MSNYAALIAAVLTIAVIVPASILSHLFRPRRYIEFFRGGDISVCLACSIGGLFPLLLILTGASVPYPGVFRSIFTMCAFALIGLLLWGRVQQYVRHKIKNDRAAEMGMQQLADMGEDVSEFQKRP